MQFNRQFARSTWQALRAVGSVAAATTNRVGRFAIRHRESVIGGVAGYALGRLIECIPFVGPLLSPLASLVLGTGGGVAGYQKELERRRIEVLERDPRWTR
jgi:hypothetical protein